MPATDRMVWVSLPRATFGIVIRDGKIRDEEPYATGAAEASSVSLP